MGRSSLLAIKQELAVVVCGHEIRCPPLQGTQRDRGGHDPGKQKNLQKTDDRHEESREGALHKKPLQHSSHSDSGF